MESTLDEHQRRDLWGLALFALTLLLALSFFPTDWLGAAGARWFPTGNVVGVAGRGIHGGAQRLWGLAAVLLPVFPGLAGLVVLDRLALARAVRIGVLAAGALLIVPAALGALAHPAPSPAGGWFGTTVGGSAAVALGTVGALLVLATLGAALCVATIGWNPARAAVRGGRAASGGLRERIRELARRFGPSRGSAADFAGAESTAPSDLTRLHADSAAEPTVWAERSADSMPDDSAAPWEEVAPPGPAAGSLAAELESLWAARSPAPAARPAALVDPDDTVVEWAPAVPVEAHAIRSAPAPSPATVVAAGSQAEGFQDLPASSLLVAPPPRDEARNTRLLDEAGRVLMDKLGTFKIQGELVGRTVGPVVTQFEVEPAPGIKVSRIAGLEADLALAMRAPSVRIVAPIPGKGAVGVEVPNPEPETVYFREVVESPAFRNSKAQLPIALGKDLAGRPYVADLARTPHLLIAGATGSGKSVCVNTIITSLVYRHTPETLRLLMVDPKMVELSMYNALPHLRHPVVTDNNDAAAVLKWAVLEMERRYQLLSANGVRNLQDFNKRVEEGALLRAVDPQGPEGDPDRWLYRSGVLPFVVVIIDELADLMMTVQNDVEKPLALLAQKARAIGIHLILATQRPSVNVITGLIKANFPSRIAFRVSSKIDSRTILDQNGAETLLGNGDMLFMPPGANDPVRIQGAYLSTEETEQLTAWYRARSEALGLPIREDDILELVRSQEGTSDGDDDATDMSGDWDRLFRDAAEVCIQAGSGSTSLLQRRLRIGYGRAARIIDQLHQANVLGPPDGSKPREVLVLMGDLDGICPAER